MLAINTDITERLALEEQLQQSQRLEAVGQLTGGVAHDFNNLLTVILGNSELLEEQLEETPLLRDSARLIRGAAERAAELTRRLLAFARRQPLDPCTDLAELIGLLQHRNPESAPRKTQGRSQTAQARSDNEHMFTSH